MSPLVKVVVRLCLSVIAAGCLLTSTAEAQTIFDNRAAWVAAANRPLSVLNFEGLLTCYRKANLGVSGMVTAAGLSIAGVDSEGVQVVFPPPGKVQGGYSPVMEGDQGTGAFLSGSGAGFGHSNSMILTAFGVDLRAGNADSGTFAHGGKVSILLYSASSDAQGFIVDVPANGRFWGYITTDRVSFVRVTPFGGAMSVDNATYAAANDSIVSAPNFGNQCEPPPSTPGSSPANPLMPTTWTPTVFNFPQGTGGAWHDPPLVNSYRLSMTGNSLFTDVLAFPPGFGAPFRVLVNGRSLGLFSDTRSVSFNNGVGVPEFIVTGIQPLVDAESPTAFPIKLGFNTPTASFQMTPLTLGPSESYRSALDADQQVPPVVSSGTGVGTVLLNETETEITVGLSFSGLTSPATAAHIHGPAADGVNAGVLFDVSDVTPSAVSGTIPERTFAITVAQVLQLKAGQLYFNIHSGNFGSGEIRGQILLAPARKFTAAFTGGQEVPPNASSATGSGTVVLSPLEDAITVTGSFASLSSNATASHIHGPAAAGSTAAVLFPLTGGVGSTSGTFSEQSFAVTPTQVGQLKAGQFYFNVHSANVSDGELRGQIGALPVLTVNQGGTGLSSGAITSNPAGITCGADCAESYASGAVVTLTAAAPAAGSIFAGWMGPCSGLGTCVVSTTADTTVTAVYRLSGSSIAFTEDPLSPQQTHVKAAHITELRSAIGALRASHQLAGFAFSDPLLAAGTPIKAAHVTELRTALGAVYDQRNVPRPTYSTPVVTAGVTLVTAAHLADLRLAVRRIE